MKMKNLLLALLMTTTAMADTPPPGAVKLRGATTGDLIGDTTGSLNVYVQNPGGGSSNANQGTPNAGGAQSWWVQQYGTWNFNLPTGASTSALQTQIDSDLLAFKAANHTDMSTSNTNTAQIDTDLLTFKSANHADLLGIQNLQTSLNSSVSTAANQVQLDTDLNAFKSANHSDISTTNSTLSTLNGLVATASNQSAELSHLSSIDTKLNSPISVTGSISTSSVPNSDLVISGTMGSSGASVSQNISGVAEGVISIVGSFVGSINVQCVYPGGVTSNLATLQPSPTLWSSAAITAPGNYKIRGMAGCPKVQAVYTSYTSGAPTVVLDASSSTGNPIVSQPNAANLNAASWFNHSGTQVQGSADASGNLNVNTVSVSPTSDYVASGVLTGLSSAVVLSTNGIGEVGINVQGTFVGSIAVQGIPSGGGTMTNLPINQSGLWSSTILITAPGFYKVRGIGGFASVEAIFTAYTSGSANINLEGTQILGSPSVVQTNAANLNGTMKVVDTAGVNQLAIGTSGNILVSGASAIGSPPILNPIGVSGVDGAGNKQHLTMVTGTNALKVDVSSSSPPTGSSTSANQVLQLAQETTTATNSANIGSVSELFVNFSKVIASGVDTTFWNLIQTGSGQTVSQSAGNLVVTAGTTANSETIIRSLNSYTGSLIFKETSILSQRIANNNFYAELVDDVGDGLSYTINSATSVTVTFVTNPFTSQSVGQSMYLGAITGAAGIPGRYAIASVSGNTVTYTVAGWPASGSGTLSLWGLNYYHVLYTGTTSTNANFDTQRTGWNNGDTVATINTTASPGHLAIVTSEDYAVSLQDALTASSIVSPNTFRASRVTNIPDYVSTPLYVQLHVLNGTTAPASTTTWTVGQIALEGIKSNPVTVGNIKPQSSNATIPVTVQNVPATTISSGTLTTVSTVSSVTAVASDSLATNSNVADLASTAKTATFTLAVTPAAGAISYAAQLNVTAVSGTTPTMDCSILESLDGGTTYPKTVYTFERVTAVLAAPLVSPLIRYGGSKLEYSCVIGGTTPSFTMALNRVGSQVQAATHYNLFDRTMSPNVTTTPGVTWFTEGCSSGSLTYSQSASTTNPTIALQTSGDGVNWATTTYTITPSGVGTFTVPIPVLGAKYSRASTSSAGTGVTYSYSEINCTGP